MVTANFYLGAKVLNTLPENGHKSQTVREAMDNFLADPDPMYYGLWGSDPKHVSFSVDADTFRRFKLKARRHGFSYNKALAIGLMNS